MTKIIFVKKIMVSELVKTIHILSAILWFASMFFTSTLLLKWRTMREMASGGEEVVLAAYLDNTQRVYKRVMTPAMIITWLAGLWLLYLYGYEWFKSNLWMHFKILFVLLLSGYHGMTKVILKKMGQGQLPFKNRAFLLFTDFPIILLTTIVALAVYQNRLSPIQTGTVSFGLALAVVTLKNLLKK